ncbi:hypothetical protein [Nocardia yunnanensis]|nr:hypothetical protein [Nocardia yunnanensis]
MVDLAAFTVVVGAVLELVTVGRADAALLAAAAGFIAVAFRAFCPGR